MNYNSSNDCIVIGKHVYLNGVWLPDCPTRSNSTTVVQENGHIYINGWEWKNNEWRKTFKAFLKCLFA